MTAIVYQMFIRGFISCFTWFMLDFVHYRRILTLFFIQRIPDRKCFCNRLNQMLLTGLRPWYVVTVCTDRNRTKLPLKNKENTHAHLFYLIMNEPFKIKRWEILQRNRLNTLTYKQCGIALLTPYINWQHHYTIFLYKQAVISY